MPSTLVTRVELTRPRLVGRAEQQDVLAGQVQLARLAGLLDEIPEPVHAPPLVGVAPHVVVEQAPLEIDHPEHQASSAGSGRPPGRSRRGRPPARPRRRRRCSRSRLGREHDRGPTWSRRRPRRPPAGPEHPAREGMQQIGARLTRRAGRARRVLNGLRVEGDGVAGRERRRDRAAALDHPVDDLAPHAGTTNSPGRRGRRASARSPRPRRPRTLGVDDIHGMTSAAVAFRRGSRTARRERPAPRRGGTRRPRRARRGRRRRPGPPSRRRPGPAGAGQHSGAGSDGLSAALSPSSYPASVRVIGTGLPEQTRRPAAWSAGHGPDTPGGVAPGASAAAPAVPRLVDGGEQRAGRFAADTAAGRPRERSRKSVTLARRAAAGTGRPPGRRRSGNAGASPPRNRSGP